MKVGIIGGGWAGLSAAVTAVRLGYQVRLFESATVLGGRARSVQSPALDTTIDNGQHILLGAYTATLDLMHSLGLDTERQFRRLPLSLLSADHTLRLRTVPVLPAPLHLAAGLLTARGLNWREKRAALLAINQLRLNDWKTPRDATVKEWLSLTLQPPRLQRLLWIPLCVATMNTAAHMACAQLFANVLRDSLGASRREAGDMLIPRKTLSELWPARVEELAIHGALSTLAGAGLEVLRSTTVRSLRYAPARVDAVTARSASESGRPQLLVDERPEPYDALILCGNTISTARLLGCLSAQPGSAAYLDDLRAFQHAPIATLTLELANPVSLPAPMLLLHEDRSRGHYGQWLFQGQDPDRYLLHVVISDAEALLTQERETAVIGMIEQLRTQLAGQSLPPVLRHTLIAEKRATFLAVPGLKRPTNDSPWPGVWVAGDWTDTGYPGVLEGAVRSGRQAAHAMHAELSG